MGYKDSKLTAQPPINTTQPQAHSKCNKGVINISSTSLSQAQESLLSKGPNYAVTPKNPPI